MTVTTQDVSKSYKPGSAMTAEPVGFQFLDAIDLVVTHIADATGMRTVLVPGTDYAIGGDGMALTGTITASTVWPDDDLFLVERATPGLQKVHLPAQQPIPSIDVERQLDRQALFGQEIDARTLETAARAVMAALGEAGQVLPTRAALAGKWLAGDAEGNLISMLPSGSDGALQAALASLVGAAMLGFKAIGAGAVTRSVQSELRDRVSVTQYGALAGDLVGDAGSINAALVAGAGGQVLAPPGLYLIDQPIIIPDDTTLVGAGWGSIYKKNTNGPMLKMGKRSRLIGGQFDGNRGTYTGGSVLVETGDNTTTIADQGHQLIEGVLFVHIAGYPIDYTTANKGWLSTVQHCAFSDYGSDAAVKWPDEAALGGNRKVLYNYSDKPIVNVGGCDNGLIDGNACGGTNATNQGIVCPAGTTHRAKKVIVVNNRIAIQNGTVNFRGTEWQWDNNIIAGSVVFEDNAANDGALSTSFTSSNTLVGTFTDNSGADNNIVLNNPIAFTPAWTGGAPVLGNADVRCDWTRDRGFIRAHYNITFGSSSSYGAGAWSFSLPVPRYSAINTDVIAAASIRAKTGLARTIFATGDKLQLYTAAGALVGSATEAWAAGDQLIFSIEYRIF